MVNLINDAIIVSCSVLRCHDYMGIAQLVWSLPRQILRRPILGVSAPGIVPLAIGWPSLIWDHLLRW